MIVRTWHGCVPLQHAEGFARHLELTGGNDVPGNPLATEARWCCRKPREWAHFFLATYFSAGSRGGQSLRWRRLSRRGHLSDDEDIRTPSPTP